MNNPKDTDFDDWFGEINESSLDIVNQKLIMDQELLGVDYDQRHVSTNSDETNSDECEYIYVEDIIKTDLTELATIHIIQYECSLAHFIKAMVENTNKTFYDFSEEIRISQNNSDKTLLKYDVELGLGSKEISSERSEVRPTGSSEQSEVRLTGSSEQSDVRPTGSSEQSEVRPTGSSEQSEVRPTGSSEQSDVRPTGSSEQSEVRPTGSSEQSDVRPTGSSEQSEVQPTGSFTHIQSGLLPTPGLIPIYISTNSISLYTNQKRFSKLKSIKYADENSKLESIKVSDKLMTVARLTDIIIYLEWISSASEILSNRIKQEILKYVPPMDSTIPPIVRSSYIFCIKSTQCKNFYNKDEFPKCKNHHYVHSLLKYDTDSIIMFLKYIIDNGLELTIDQLNNLYLSVKTICFVIRNMQKEICYIHHITKNNSEIYHRCNPIDLCKKTSYPKPNWNNKFEKNKYPIRGGFIQSNRYNRLHLLNKLNQVDQVDQVDGVDQMDEADEAAQIDQLDEINQLNQLDQLDQLNQLAQLNQLDQLALIDQLDQLDQSNQTNQSDRPTQMDQPIETDQLDQSTKTDQLDQPHQTNQLDQLHQQNHRMLKKFKPPNYSTESGYCKQSKNIHKSTNPNKYGQYNQFKKIKYPQSKKSPYLIQPNRTDSHNMYDLLKQC